MKQYHLQNNILNLQVKKTPFLVRAILFVIAFVLFIFPVVGAIFGIALGNGLHIGYFIGIGFCSLIGFYTLRVALWNTYGNETIQILDDKVIYEANYGWFKDGKKELLVSNPNFYVVSAGYEEDNEGVLIIGCDDAKVESVVKIGMIQLEELTALLQNSKK
ncbi:hypothetical protein AAYQ05_20825 [Flavobacterium sp. B11]|uniref:hypothetical protein n=1 Tax=Flavobacterium movens TaxID=214860 RepID=UPI0031D2E32C